MSGEAGGVLESECFGIFVGSGRIVSVAIMPGGDGNDVAAYFQSENAPYQEWLARAKPALEALFAELALDPLKGPVDHARRLYLQGWNRLDNHQSLRVTIQPKQPMDKPSQDRLLDQIATVLKAHQ